MSAVHVPCDGGFPVVVPDERASSESHERGTPTVR